ncbi:hypothetical protein [Methanosarcina sp. UBA5]|uniref:hypothetical protein n=1 Tax=Methanosarcina sp. UBA5 TaxID=1915593 RepID=UPI0025DC0DE9|nr:hypothetical protein [Methanosarcina sp. UBA5]
MINTSYKQQIKEKSREAIWNHAIDSLTLNQNNSKILNAKYIQRLWDYSFEEYLLKYKVIKKENADESVLDSWINFANKTYGNKEPSDLKIAYFCGPEPENDLKLMLSKGILIENVWAFENDKETYYNALENAKDRYEQLKIYNGSIESFLEIYPLSFDIIYLDFTSSLLSKKTFKTIHTIFDKQALSEIGILIINSTLPEHSEENVDFLTKYFLPHTFIEEEVCGEDLELLDDVGSRFIEMDKFKQLIDNNFEGAYSAFASQYPMLYSNIVQPIFRILKINSARKRFFNINEDRDYKQILKIDISRMENIKILCENLFGDEIENFRGSEFFTSPENYPMYHFIRELKDINSNWFNYYTNKENEISRFDAIKFRDLLLTSCEGYVNVLSETLKEAIPKICKVIPDNNGGIFCDIPMFHLWLELALNQLGYPYHSNVKNHKRHKYIAKERKMFVDIFTFDRCRALYDWLPMVEFYADNLMSIEKQIIVRSCIDAIRKESTYIIDNLYLYSNLIGFGEKSWVNFATLEERENFGSEEIV